MTVRCFNPGGNQLAVAFAYANDPLAASYTPPNSFSSRQPIIIARRGTGEYDVQFTGAARAPGDLAEAVVLTAAGSSGNLCTLHDKMISATVRVHCWFGYDEDLIMHSDEPFSIALIERGRLSSRAGTAWVQKSSFPQTRTLPADSASSTGGAVLVERTGNLALSILTFRGLGRSSAAARENVQLIGVEDEDASYCKIVDWTSVPRAHRPICASRCSAIMRTEAWTT